MREYFGRQVLKTVIHRNIRLAEAPSAGQPAIIFDRNCAGAQEYMQLAEEIVYEEVRLAQTDYVHI
jgi:chromosome partitioning protein